MKALPFSLRPLCLLLRREERKAEQDCARAATARDLALDRLQAIVEELVAGWAELKRRSAKQSLGVEVSAIQAWRRALDRRKARQERLARRAIRNAQLASARLFGLRKALAVLERMCAAQRACAQRRRQGRTAKTLKPAAPPVPSRPAPAALVPIWN